MMTLILAKRLARIRELIHESARFIDARAYYAIIFNTPGFGMPKFGYQSRQSSAYRGFPSIGRLSYGNKWNALNAFHSIWKRANQETSGLPCRRRERLFSKAFAFACALTCYYYAFMPARSGKLDRAHGENRRCGKRPLSASSAAASP